jgi:hypothetical protein
MKKTTCILVLTAGLALAGAVAVGGGVYALNHWHQARHEAPTSGLVPVAA